LNNVSYHQQTMTQLGEAEKTERIN